ncbi:Hypothetical protein R9X50_00020700 [Acrodontium crateriforme]|uniref:Rhodopsin domain-containing protein n=1 Tax=Acrodontium crateriforme TaxID=150365 RepID=A0AAQ3R904_9PEZI|nr:Hypothetical protein R9X50_00020700 [Acrodontium crateriforme]
MPGNLEGIPPEVRASWPKPNYINPVTRRWLIPFVIVLQVLSTLVVGTRLYLRARKQAGSLGLDDAVLVPAWMGATVFTTIAVISTIHWGSDRHMWDVNPDHVVRLIMGAWIGEFTFTFSTACTKISVLMFYRRMVAGTFSKRWKYATIAAITFTICYMIAFCLVLIFNCNPTDAYWKAWDPTWTTNYHCADTITLNALSGIISVFSDLYCVLLPMGMTWHFEAPIGQKLALNAVFSLGLLVVAAGSARTYYLWALGRSYDTTWAGYVVYIFAALEMQLALICAAAPSLRVFFRKYLSSPISRAIKTGRSNTSSGRVTRNDSKQSDVIPLSSRSRDSYIISDYGDKTPIIKHTIKPDLDPVDEVDSDREGLPRVVHGNAFAIKTPEDFEAYALRNLEECRPATRQTMSKLNDEPYEMEPNLQHPAPDFHPDFKE